jgi:hypothetical protein
MQANPLEQANIRWLVAGKKGVPRHALILAADNKLLAMLRNLRDNILSLPNTIEKFNAQCVEGSERSKN